MLRPVTSLKGHTRCHMLEHAKSLSSGLVGPKDAPTRYGGDSEQHIEAGKRNSSSDSLYNGWTASYSVMRPISLFPMALSCVSSI